MSTLQVEVTIAAFLMTPAGHVLGDSIVSATVGFGTRAVDQPGMSDEAIVKELSAVMGPVIATVRLALTTMGFAYLGDLPERVLDHAHQVRTGLTPEMLVKFRMGDTPEGRA